MAKLIKFPSDYPVSQWEIRRKIERYLNLLGWDMARCMLGFSADGPERWPLMDDSALNLMLEYVREEYLLHQAKLKQPAPAAPVTEPPKPQRPARLIVFPSTPEMEVRLQAIKKAKPKKTGKPAAAPKPKQATARAEGGRQASAGGKARLIRKVKMVQRDCEKLLPEFNDYAYRAILQERYDAASSKELDGQQLLSLLLYLQGLLNGKNSGKASYDAPALLHEDKSGLGRNRKLWKLQALLAEKGKEEGRYIPWAYALGILKRQTGGLVAVFDRATPKQIDAVIAALCQDAGRKGRRTR